MNTRNNKLTIIFSLLFFSLFCSGLNGQQVFKSTKDGEVIIQTKNDSVKIEVLSDHIFRIVHHCGNLSNKYKDIPFVLPLKTDSRWNVKETKKGIEISTGQMFLVIDKTGLVSFYDSKGTPLTSELNSTTGPQQAFSCGDEALYGMGHSRMV